MRPFVTAAMTGYLLTSMSLNHLYYMSTYAILGIAAAYIQLADSDQPPAGEFVDGWFIRRLAFVSALFLALSMLYIKVFLRR
jgi:hypothetical protein